MTLKILLFRIRRYLIFWLECLDSHSLQAPFIYGFFNDVIKGTSDKSKFSGIENLRKILLTDDSILNIKDLGAGSTLRKKTERTVKAIARKGISSADHSLFFHRIISYFDFKNVLELGSSFGINTLYLATYPSVQKVITIEGCPEIANIANQSFKGLSEDKITLLKGNINDVLPKIHFEVNQFDFILIDANHTYEATLNYYNNCKQFIHENSVIVFDDIYWSQDMHKAWKEISNDIVVTLSIDLYDLGIIFFKKHLQKEHYILSGI